jgi:hypothetical protein
VEVSFAVDRDTVTLPFDFGATERTRSDISPHREQVNSRVILDSGRADDRNWHSRDPQASQLKSLLTEALLKHVRVVLNRRP